MDSLLKSRGDRTAINIAKIKWQITFDRSWRLFLLSEFSSSTRKYEYPPLIHGHRPFNKLFLLSNNLGLEIGWQLGSLLPRIYIYLFLRIWVLSVWIPLNKSKKLDGRDQHSILPPWLMVNLEGSSSYLNWILFLFRGRTGDVISRWRRIKTKLGWFIYPPTAESAYWFPTLPFSVDMMIDIENGADNEEKFRTLNTYSFSERERL